MLPRLLATYRKYGSLAWAWPLCENHFCTSGAVVATTKNGRPTVTSKSHNTQKTGSGLVGTEAATSAGNAIGKTSRGTTSTPRCTAGCKRKGSHEPAAWAYR